MWCVRVVMGCVVCVYVVCCYWFRGVSLWFVVVVRDLCCVLLWCACCFMLLC